MTMTASQERTSRAFLSLMVILGLAAGAPGILEPAAGLAFFIAGFRGSFVAAAGMVVSAVMYVASGLLSSGRLGSDGGRRLRAASAFCASSAIEVEHDASVEVKSLSAPGQQGKRRPKLTCFRGS